MAHPDWRPAKLDIDVARKLVMLVRAGNFMETAAAACGVDGRTLREWLRRAAKGGKGSKEYRKLAHDLMVAEAEAVAQEGPIDWRAMPWTSARRKAA